MISAYELKLYRKKMGLTQEEFAKVLRVSPKSAWSYEKGQSTPLNSVQILIDILAILCEADVFEHIKNPEYKDGKIIVPNASKPLLDIALAIIGAIED